MATLADIKTKVDELIAATARRDDAFVDFDSKRNATEQAKSNEAVARDVYHDAAGVQHRIEDELEAMVVEFEPEPVEMGITDPK